eukprot:TRINITY_DN73397_c0_g1_i1.p1 TRINITY_DN73397_c0_g1~~TRINITY_DN73397_c0_g1_i1.p1  ORF type:complete len:245 (+),score=23.43 TRINITY_DN73397_c0_g1_i1:66-800(+)
MMFLNCWRCRQHSPEPPQRRIPRTLVLCIRDMAGEALTDLLTVADTTTVYDLKRMIRHKWTGAGSPPLTGEQTLLFDETGLIDDDILAEYDLPGDEPPGEEAPEPIALLLLQKRFLSFETLAGDRDLYGGNCWKLKVQGLGGLDEMAWLQSVEDNISTMRSDDVLSLLQDLPSNYGVLDVRQHLLDTGQADKWTALENLIEGADTSRCAIESPFGIPGTKQCFFIRIACANHGIAIDGWSHNWD